LIFSWIILQFSEPDIIRQVGTARWRASRDALKCALSFRGEAVEKIAVGIVMGSQSDWDVMQHVARQLKDFGVTYEARALSAHRTPDILIEWIAGLEKQGAQCFVAGAGGAAHLAGVVASKTTLPVLGVPMPSKHLQGLDSLLSIVQMPKGIPVATFAIGEAGAANAGLFAVAMLALNDAALAKKLAAFRAKQAAAVQAVKLPELS
jgi:5-(carboxyamino)imidazole ribonucleotide mutase